MNRQEIILNGFDSAWAQQIKLSGNTNSATNGITVSDPINGGSAVLIKFIDGLPAPTFTAAQIAAIPNPSEGLTVYQTDGTAGLYSYNGSDWVLIATSGGTLPVLVTLTYAEAQQLVADSLVVVGQLYKISDKADLGIFLKGVSDTTFSLDGVGGFLNPDFSSAGNYTGVEAITNVPYTSTKGVWYAILEGTLIDGDVVFWNGLHYQCVDVVSVNGTDPATNTLAYAVLNKSEVNVGYIQSFDTIQYDFTYDWIQFRADSLGNYFAYSRATDNIISNYLGYSAITLYQWGNPQSVNYVNQGQLQNINFAGRTYGNVVNPLGVIIGMTALGDSSGIINNFIGSGITLSSKEIPNSYQYVNSILFLSDSSVETLAGNTSRTMNTLLKYDDDTAAGLAGVVRSQQYQTLGGGTAPLNVAGIVMMKQ